MSKTQTTYTAISNQSDVNYWDCGHKHRSVKATVKCLNSMGAAACSYYALVYGSDGTAWDRNACERHDYN